ncbi:MAG: amidohydrolase family protein [Ignavibacteriaceae bacterium]
MKTMNFTVVGENYKKMRFAFPILFFVLLMAACNNRFHDVDLVITNVTIVDPVNQKITPSQNILIKDSIIQEIFDNSIKINIADSLIIDGTGKYVISGFWNMHTHVCWKEDLNETLFPVLLSYGITGVRDMAGDAEIMNSFKHQIENDPTSGPLIYGPGPILDGENPIHPDFSVALTEMNLQQTLDSLYSKKVDFLKVYSLLPANIVEQISAYSQKRNIDFAGHISEYISPVKAAKLHQKSFEHLNRIEELYADTAELNAFIQAVRDNQSWLCPTMIIYKRKIEIAEGKDLYHPLYEVVDNYIKAEWQQIKARREGAVSSPGKLDQLITTYNAQKELIKLFYQKNVPMLIGSDFGGMAFIYPGYSYHEEMALFAELGFDNYDILRMATYNPALYFNISTTHGSIEKGKVADLVLLDKNPIDNIHNTREIVTVIREGKKVKLPPTNNERY